MEGRGESLSDSRGLRRWLQNDGVTGKNRGDQAVDESKVGVLNRERDRCELGFADRTYNDFTEDNSRSMGR